MEKCAAGAGVVGLLAGVSCST